MYFSRQESVCGSASHTGRGQKSQERHFFTKKAPAAVHHTHTPGYHSQMDTDIFVTGHTHIQFEL
jgi:hypothetical protein